MYMFCTLYDVFNSDPSLGAGSFLNLLHSQHEKKLSSKNSTHMNTRFNQSNSSSSYFRSSSPTEAGNNNGGCGVASTSSSTASISGLIGSAHQVLLPSSPTNNNNNIQNQRNSFTNFQPANQETYLDSKRHPTYSAPSKSSSRSFQKYSNKSDLRNEMIKYCPNISALSSTYLDQPSTLVENSPTSTSSIDNNFFFNENNDYSHDHHHQQPSYHHQQVSNLQYLTQHHHNSYSPTTYSRNQFGISGSLVPGSNQEGSLHSQQSVHSPFPQYQYQYQQQHHQIQPQNYNQSYYSNVAAPASMKSYHKQLPSGSDHNQSTQSFYSGY